MRLLFLLRKTIPFFMQALTVYNESLVGELKRAQTGLEDKTVRS